MVEFIHVFMLNIIKYHEFCSARKSMRPTRLPMLDLTWSAHTRARREGGEGESWGGDNRCRQAGRKPGGRAGGREGGRAGGREGGRAGRV